MRKKHTHHIRESVKSAYTAIAAEFDQTRQRPWPEFDHFLTYVNKGAKVLDVGCGNGRLSDLLSVKEVDYLGTDNNAALLEKARQNHPDARFELMDMVDLSALPNGAFDAVFSVAAFHHLPDKKTRKKSMLEMHRVLKKEGVLIVTVWNLFQWRYASLFLKSFFRFLVTFGFGSAWNDVWVKWGKSPLKRYYHAFTASEFRSFFPSDLWEVEEFYFTRKKKRVSFFQSFNLILIARKK